MLSGLDCYGCRANYAHTARDVPCETDAGCPYGDNSPGDAAALAPENFRAVWLHARLQTLGPLALDLLDWDLAPAEADLLSDQLMLLARHTQRATEG